MNASLSSLLVLLISVWGSLAMAQPSPDDLARAHFKLGSAHYESGEFLKAAGDFEEAFRISKRPQLYFNIYLAYRDANEPRKAADALNSFLTQVEDVPNRGQLEAKLEALSKGLADAESEGADEAPPSEDIAGPTSDAEMDPTQEATPPAHAVTDSDAGGGGSKVLPITLLASGGALVLASVVTGLMASSAESELERECPSRTGCDPALESTQSRGKTMALVTDVMWITGLVTAGTGAVLLLMGGNQEKPTASVTTPRASVGCGPTSCGASMRMRF